MDKLKKWLIWAGLFVLVSCSNVSEWCKHRYNRTVSAFQYIHPMSVSNEAAARSGSFLPNALQAAELKWQTLNDVTFRKKWNQQYKSDFMYPVFGEKVKKLNGRELYITGFMIPLNIKEGLYAVSFNPYSSCYFCGGAGPESVVSLKFKTKPRRYDTDEYLTMKGTLVLNDTNVNDFIYIFKDADEYEPNK